MLETYPSDSNTDSDGAREVNRSASIADSVGGVAIPDGIAICAGSSSESSSEFEADVNHIRGKSRRLQTNNPRP